MVSSGKGDGRGVQGVQGVREVQGRNAPGCGTRLVCEAKVCHNKFYHTLSRPILELLELLLLLPTPMKINRDLHVGMQALVDWTR